MHQLLGIGEIPNLKSHLWLGIPHSTIPTLRNTPKESLRATVPPKTSADSPDGWWTPLEGSEGLRFSRSPGWIHMNSRAPVGCTPKASSKMLEKTWGFSFLLSWRSRVPENRANTSHLGHRSCEQGCFYVGKGMGIKAFLAVSMYQRYSKVLYLPPIPSCGSLNF